MGPQQESAARQPPKQPRAYPTLDVVTLDTVEYVQQTAKGDAVIMGRRNGASVAIEIPKAELHRLAAALKYPLKPSRK